MTEFNLPKPNRPAPQGRPAGEEEVRQAWAALQSACGSSEKEAAIVRAMSLGVALSDIESLLDWLDAVAESRAENKAENKAVGETKPVALPAPWAAPHFRPRQPPGDSFA